MKLTLTTPALLFPAISLLLLAYTNRFLTLSTLVRDLHARYKEGPDEILSGQINNLKTRIKIINHMQILGVSAFFLCVFCMFLLFLNRLFLANIVFVLSLLLLMTSLGFSILELRISIHALMLQLSDFRPRRDD